MDPELEGAEKAATPSAGDTTGPSPTTAGGGGGGRAILLGGLTTLIAALTAVATVNGEVARMFRNHWVLTLIAILLVLSAVLCGMLTQTGFGVTARHWLLVAGTGTLVLGMGFALWAQVRSLSQSDRPTITAHAEATGDNMRVTAHVGGAKAKMRDQIVVIVYGRHLDGSRGSPIYYAKTGPDTDGDLSQDIEIEVDRKLLGGVYITR